MMILATCFQSMAYVFKTRQYIVPHFHANPATSSAPASCRARCFPAPSSRSRWTCCPGSSNTSASTAVINAYVDPPVKHYVRSMVSRIQRAGTAAG